MASYLNPSSTASAGTAIGKDPDARGGLRERARIVGGVHRLLSGGVAQDYTGTLRRWQLRWTGLTNAQWTVIKSYIQGGYQLYWQGPEMSAKVAVILEDAEQDQVHLNGDSASAPHWNVSLTLREGTLANAVQYVYGDASITLGAVTLSSAGTVVNILIFDQFTDTNGTALASHTISPNNSPATSWTLFNAGALGTTLAIQSNAVLSSGFPSGNTRVGAQCDSGVADCTVSADLITSSTTEIDAGLVVRYTDANNHWRITLNSDGTDTFYIIECNGGTETTRASVGKTIATSTTYSIQAVLSGNSITATVDGGSSINYASATFQNTATKHGITEKQQGGFKQHQSWDNFKVIA